MESYFAYTCYDYCNQIEAEQKQEMHDIVKAPNQAKQIAASSKAMRKQLQKHPSFLDCMRAASIAATEALAPAL